MINKIKKILEHMKDEESKFLFEKKLESVVWSNPLIFQLALWEMKKDCKCEDIEELDRDENKGIYIFGAGLRGIGSYFLLKNFNLHDRVIAFLDNDVTKVGEMLYGKKIMSLHDPKISSDSVILIAANGNTAGQMYAQIMTTLWNIKKSDIIYPRLGYIRAIFGRQYFDVFSPKKNEFFIDAGAADGDSSLEFASWSKRDYAGIYAFDPYKAVGKLYHYAVKENQLHGTKFFPKGLWDRATTLIFRESGSSSRIVTNGLSTVEVVALDEVLEGNRPTFIKMDIEGAELKALKGAARSIKKFHPRMAICVYHKTEDIIAIPDYILSLDDTYRFYIRCYSSDGDEIVLYAE